MTRRIRLRDRTICSIRFAFVMPSMTGFTDGVIVIPFLMQRVPCWALASAFKTNSAKIYRIANAFGRYNIVKETVKTKIPATYLPMNIPLPTAVFPAMSFANRQAEEELTKGYGVFKDEALATSGLSSDEQYVGRIDRDKIKHGKTNILSGDRSFTAPRSRHDCVAGRGRCCIITVIGVRKPAA
jgi:hypothetical protein